MGKVFIGSQDNFEWVGVFFNFDGGKSIWGESTREGVNYKKLNCVLVLVFFQFSKMI